MWIKSGLFVCCGVQLHTFCSSGFENPEEQKDVIKYIQEYDPERVDLLVTGGTSEASTPGIAHHTEQTNENYLPA
jgi:hypothetical protein